MKKMRLNFRRDKILSDRLVLASVDWRDSLLRLFIVSRQRIAASGLLCFDFPVYFQYIMFVS